MHSTQASRDYTRARLHAAVTDDGDDENAKATRVRALGEDMLIEEKQGRGEGRFFLRDALLSLAPVALAPNEAEETVLVDAPAPPNSSGNTALQPVDSDYATPRPVEEGEEEEEEEEEEEVEVSTDFTDTDLGEEIQHGTLNASGTIRSPNIHQILI